MNIRAKGTDRLLDVLDVMMQQEKPITRNAIAAILGAPRTTIYSVIDTLLTRGYLDQIEPDGLIVPGRRCGLLGFAYDKSTPLLREAKDVVKKLSEATGELVELDVLQDWKQLILVSRSGRGHTYRGASEGTRMPLPWTASARFLLQNVARDDLARFIPSEDFSTPSGQPTSLDILSHEIGLARETGFWIARGLVDPYIGCVAAPVNNRQGHCIGVICLILPLQELAKREETLTEMTIQAAKALTASCTSLQNPSF
ncbi:IclR family transcriptional regulator [Agrobacterium sp. BA1120]|uniref:IclR family transcriptional regulator n=1 Tax=Agrobacterium sp. BA1120 TaxID=3228927 RepID=UPI00336AE267